ncbi:uncharacterized protein LOC132281715 [Cornus florida]|uniref:uncharacterized protein LOC132281715 n=1 Tax=Cornus florida TaxID=4283 RepID=UPI00289DD900|nr:uncharacterized protein LOC132281715 [Cornus florida]
MEASEITNCHPETAIETFKISIIQGTKFHTSLVKYSPPNMQTLNVRAQIYIRLEENVAHQAQHATIVTVENKPREKASSSKSQRSQHASAPVAQVPEKRQRIEERFTPFCTTLARLFQENRMRFIAPQLMRQPLEQRDKNKHCAYHRDYGHTTNDCRSFRRQVKNMITRCELADYLTPKEHVKLREVNPWKVEGNQVKVIHVIYGRSEDDQESEEVYRSRLRATHKLRKLSSINTIASSSISIGFGDGDLSRVQLPHEGPLVISFLPTSSSLLGFDDTKVDLIGVIDLSVTAAKKTLKENFVLIEIHHSYNLIVGRGWIHRMHGVLSTLHQVMRYLSPDGKEVIDLWGDQVAAKECYILTLNEQLQSPLPKYLKAEEEAEAPKPTEESLETVEVVLDNPHKITYMGSSPTPEEKQVLIDVIRRNADAFAWDHSDMLGISPPISCHSLKVDPAFKPVKQRHR